MNVEPEARSAPCEDTHLVAAAQGGDAAALESLLLRHYDRCYAICRRVLADDQDALDATQEAMIAIVRGIGNFDGRSSFSTWTYRVATNVALDELRRRRRRPLADWSAAAREGSTTFDQLPSTTRGDEVGDSVAARVSLDRALLQVSEEHRAAVVLRDVLDLEYAEIAEVLRVPIGTVRSRIARGRLALARALRAADAPHPGAGGAAAAPAGNREATVGVQAHGPDHD